MENNIGPNHFTRHTRFFAELRIDEIRFVFQTFSRNASGSNGLIGAFIAEGATNLRIDQA